MSQDTLPRLLIVDDDVGMRQVLREGVKPVAAQVSEAHDAPSALEKVESGAYDVVVCDLCMPNASGLELLRMAHQAQWDVAFILVSGNAGPDDVATALHFQASDFLLKPVRLRDLQESVRRSHQRLVAERRSRRLQELLESSLQRRTVELHDALRAVEAGYTATLEAMVAALDVREHETFAHSYRVRAYTAQLARLVGYPPALMRQLETAALLHDIGKVATPDAILLKPAKLTEEEWNIMKRHPADGESILRRVPFLAPASRIVREHHERFDGKGYPDGLAGEAINFGARIFAFADTLDAMTSDRAYRKAPGFEAAYKEIERCTGSQFDPGIARVFLSVPGAVWQQLREEVNATYRAQGEA